MIVILFDAALAAGCLFPLAVFGDAEECHVVIVLALMHYFI